MSWTSRRAGRAPVTRGEARRRGGAGTAHGHGVVTGLATRHQLARILGLLRGARRPNSSERDRAFRTPGEGAQLSLVAADKSGMIDDQSATAASFDVSLIPAPKGGPVLRRARARAQTEPSAGTVGKWTRSSPASAFADVACRAARADIAFRDAMGQLRPLFLAHKRERAYTPWRRAGGHALFCCGTFTCGEGGNLGPFRPPPTSHYSVHVERVRCGRSFRLRIALSCTVSR